MISVIVLCYNPDLEKLKCTIISIIKQKDVEYELIISDDGSALDYRRELKDWISELNLSVNVIYNFLLDNVGTVKNILSAVKLANGEYIKTISPGDYFFDEYSLSVYYSHLCIGNISFDLFLIHQLSIRYCTVLLTHFGINMSWLYCLVAVILAVSASVIHQKFDAIVKGSVLNKKIRLEN